MSSTDNIPAPEWEEESEDDYLPPTAEDSDIAVSCGGGITFIFDVTNESNAWMRVDGELAEGNER